MVDLTHIINAILALLAALVTAFLIPWLKKKMSAQDYATLTQIVVTAVKAAEQIYFGQDRGEEKMAYVLDILKQNGYNVDVDSITAMIEAAVLEIQK